MKMSDRLYAREQRTTGTDWIGDSIGPRAGVDVLDETKVSFHYQDPNLKSSSP